MIDTLKETVSYSIISRTYKVSVSNVIKHFDENTKNKNMIKGVEKQEIGEYKRKLEELKKYVKENELKEFEQALNTIENWEEDIENMFKYEYTNGAVERINRTIKQSKNIAFGFKNLERRQN